MIDEMRWGLEHLDDDARHRADDAVLEAIFLHPAGLALLRVASRVVPGALARLMAAASPRALGWLVGPMDTAASVNELRACAFRAEGGEGLCERVCRRPTEAFCRERAVPVRLQPHADSNRCTWTWGTS